MDVQRKISILMPTNYGKDENNQFHLYFILTDPCFNGETGDSDCVLSVSCSSIKEGKNYDDACVLQVGEHEFIKRDSFIFYNHLRIDSVSKIEREIADGKFILKELMSDTLYQRILNGLINSKHTEKRYIRFLKSAIAQNACLDIFKRDE